MRDKERLKVFPHVSNEVWIEVDGLMLYVRSTGDPGKPCLEISFDSVAKLENCHYHNNCRKLRLREGSSE